MKEILKTAILDVHQKFPIKNITPRELNIPSQPKQIITLIGPRRCGKTYFFYSLINKLIQDGISKDQILYFNFEDERFDFDASNLQNLLDAYFELFPQNANKKFYCFFDEIQQVENWEKFLRRIKDTFNPFIFITGSSSKLLSSDIATALRGRSIVYNLYPFSFREFCTHLNLQTNEIDSTRSITLLQSYFQDYLVNGGYPETIDPAENIKTRILQSYFNVMIYKDIIERFNVSNHIALKQFIKQLSSTITSEFSINKIYNDLKSNQINVSKNQLYDFLGYCQDCFLFFLHYPYEFSERKTLKSRKKCYFIDNGLLKNITTYFSDNSGKLLENLVFIELTRQNKELYFFHNGFECDFMVSENNQISQIIQVAWDVTDQKTLSREIKPLLYLAKKYPEAELFIINNSIDKIVMEDTEQIKLIPAWKWTLTDI